MAGEVCGLESLLELQIVESAIRICVHGIVTQKTVDGQRRPGIEDVVDAEREGHIR